MKPVQRSVAAVILGGPAAAGDPEGVGGRGLAVRRPPDDDALPDVWGLPAATLRPDEDWEAAVRRLGREKLGVALEPGAELREGTLERPSYLLHMKLYEARIARGEPSVPQPAAGVTQYVDWRWAAPGELVSGARRGSLCCRLFLLGWERE
jgi:hypothetical protein